MAIRDRSIGAGEFKTRCLALLDEVAETGETLVITKRGKPVAKLVPAEQAVRAGALRMNAARRLIPAEYHQASVYVDELAPQIGSLLVQIEDQAGNLGSLGLQGGNRKLAHARKVALLP